MTGMPESMTQIGLERLSIKGFEKINGDRGHPLFQGILGAASGFVCFFLVKRGKKTTVCRGLTNGSECAILETLIPKTQQKWN